MLHFIVVGANFTGVEVAGELSTFVRKAAERYRNVDPDEVRVTLVELTDRILQAIDPDLSEFAQRHMSDCGIRVFLNNSVEEIQPDSVRLSSGERLPAQTVIWTAGIAPPPLVADLPFPKDERGYLQTERDMRIAGYEDVWAIGDCAVNPGPDGSPYPPTAQHAIRQAKHAARDIAATLRGEGTRPTEIASQGSIAAIGCRGAVARVFGVKLSGFVAWWLYRTVYLLKMPGLARKVRVAIDWTMDLFFPRDYVQLRVHGSRRPAESRSGGADEALEPATSGSTP